MNKYTIKRTVATTTASRSLVEIHVTQGARRTVRRAQGRNLFKALIAVLNKVSRRNFRLRGFSVVSGSNSYLEVVLRLKRVGKKEQLVCATGLDIIDCAVKAYRSAL